MKVGRNDPCPCGSGKKYKRCCLQTASSAGSEVADDISQAIAMNPSLTIDEINTLAEHKATERNNRPIEDFYGLTPTQMENWLYAPLDALEGVRLYVPEDLSSSPVMRYLSLLIDQILKAGGSMKATAKGNLPAKIVKHASELLPEFAVAQFNTEPSISEYTGSNEDKFNALHYTRILAELADIITLKNGRFLVHEKTQKQFEAEGINAFFLPMLSAAIKQYNWGYLDSMTEDVDLQIICMFMLWRLQVHSSTEKLVEETCVAFPHLLAQLPQLDHYRSEKELLGVLIEKRFLERFLQYWGFVIVDPRRYKDGVRFAPITTMLPLLKQTFRFMV